MGLFGNKNTAPEPTPTHTNTHNSRHSHSNSTTDSSPKRGFFGRRRSSSVSSSDLDTRNNRHGSTRKSGALFHRDHEDQSITTARERVLSAEAAEREADRALVQARTAVHEARNHVKMLEREAEEEYVLAM